MFAPLIALILVYASVNYIAILYVFAHAGVKVRLDPSVGSVWTDIRLVRQEGKVIPPKFLESIVAVPISEANLTVTSVSESPSGGVEITFTDKFADLSGVPCSCEKGA